MYRNQKIKLFEIREKDISEYYVPLQRTIPPVQETMKIHQEKEKCTESKGIAEDIQKETVTSIAGACKKPVDVIDDSLVGQYTVVTYDGLPYPEIILDFDEEKIEVKVMQRIGVNRYFWPLLENRLWYKREQILSLLDSAPQPVTKRHCQIDLDIWQSIETYLNL